MQNGKSKFKNEFKGRVYKFALEVIGFVEQLSKGQVSTVIGDQLLRSATSIGANIIEAKSASSNKDYINFGKYPPITRISNRVYNPLNKLVRRMKGIMANWFTTYGALFFPVGATLLILPLTLEISSGPANILIAFGIAFILLSLCVLFSHYIGFGQRKDVMKPDFRN
ncbi:MAG: four helix bundle protein [Chloroflexi bacterium]|nr:four helix bundle protein [Chloroflexota bacterium]